MTQLTLVPAIICVLIVALLGFWLFAPTSAVASELNAQGSVIQWIWAHIKDAWNWFIGLFHKSSPVINTPTGPADPNPPTPVRPADGYALDDGPVTLMSGTSEDNKSN